jgi:hypothetical protein
MRIARGIAALTGCAALLAGCGAGGSTPAAAHATSTAGTPASAPTGVPIATASLTIKFPATFHTARKASAVTRTSAASKTRSPAYVNPTSGNQLDIYVNGVDETPGLTVNPESAGGAQSVTLPLYSSSAQQIVAVETESGASTYPPTPLAIGEADLAAGAFVPGDVTAIGLTMVMNAVGAGITSDPTGGSDATIDTSLQNPYPDTVCDGFPGNGSTLYFFSYDMELGFVSSAGLGVTVPTPSGFANEPGTYPLDSLGPPNGSVGLNTGFVISYQSGSGGVILSALFSNPAAVVKQDAVNQGGVYPGIDALYNNGTLYYAIQSIGSAAVTTQIYVAPNPEGCG